MIEQSNGCNHVSKYSENFHDVLQMFNIQEDKWSRSPCLHVYGHMTKTCLLLFIKLLSSAFSNMLSVIFYYRTYIFQTGQYTGYLWILTLVVFSLHIFV